MPQAAPADPIRLHRHPLSGHCHRVELFLSLLGLPVELIDVDFAAGAHKRPEFVAMSPFGQIPVLQDGAVTLADSNAMLVYLAAKYADESWLPRDPVGAAEVQRWLSVAAGDVAFGPCAARLVTVFGVQLDHDAAKTRAVRLLEVLNGVLAGRRFLAGDGPTIADVAGYTYIAHAPEGGVPLDPHGEVCDWLRRIEALPGFTPMPATRAGLAA